MRVLLVLALSGCVPDLAAAKKTLRTAVEDQQEDLDACYATSLERDADAKGAMAVMLHVASADGRVERVAIARSDLADPKLEKCVKSALVKVRVKPAPAADFDIDYTLQFGEGDADDKTTKTKAKAKSDE